MKILSVTWASQMGAPALIGIISYENDHGEKSIVVGTAGGFNEKEDMEHIIKHGGRLTPHQLKQILDTATK